MSYTLGLYEKAMPESFSLKEKLLCAKKYGFDFVELSIDESDKKIARLNWSDEEILAFKKDEIESGIFFKSICLSAQRKFPFGSTDEAVRTKGMQILKKAVIFAYKTGIRIIQLAGYDVYYEKNSEITLNLFKKGLKEAVEFASLYGVMLAFETMETPFMNTVEKALKYVNLINSPYLKIYPDIGNLTNSGCDLKKDILAGKGNYAAVHLKETKPEIFRECLFGTGHVNFDAAISKFKKCGVNSYLAEMWCVDSNWEENIKNASIFLRKKLDSAYNSLY